MRTYKRIRETLRVESMKTTSERRHEDVSRDGKFIWWLEGRCRGSTPMSNSQGSKAFSSDEFEHKSLNMQWLMESIADVKHDESGVA